MLDANHLLTNATLIGSKLEGNSFTFSYKGFCVK